MDHPVASRCRLQLEKTHLCILRPLFWILRSVLLAFARLKHLQTVEILMLFLVLPFCFISVCAFLTHRAPIDQFCVFTFCFISVCAFFDPRDRDPSVPHRMRRPRPAADPAASSYRTSPHRNRWRFKRVYTVAPNLTRRAPSPPPPRTGNHPTGTDGDSSECTQTHPISPAALRVLRRLVVPEITPP